MTSRIPLPDHLRTAPFLTRDARLEGIGEGRLRGRDLRRPFHGVRTQLTPAIDLPWSAQQLARLLARCREYAPLLARGQRFSHVTAARLWGCPLEAPFTAGELLHVTSPDPQRAPNRPGVAGHRSSQARTGIRHDLPVSDPVTTWLELAGLLPRDELIVAADHLLLDPRVLDPRDLRPYATLEQLEAGVRGFHGRGARAAASALREVRAGSESRQETRLRLLLVRAGLPEPEVNVAIVHEGRTLGWADLYFRRWRTIAEYDGDEHRTNTRQYDRDITRIEDLIAAGEAVVRVRARGLEVTSANTIERVKQALRRQGWPG